jgi:hypothetical protein
MDKMADLARKTAHTAGRKQTNMGMNNPVPSSSFSQPGFVGRMKGLRLEYSKLLFASS